MKKKIDAHTEMLNARLAAEQAAERKLTKDPEEGFEGCPRDDGSRCLFAG
jgi:hypothetical protein